MPEPDGEMSLVLRERDTAHAHLSRLLMKRAPNCEPAPDLIGLCWQIDNLLVGMEPVKAKAIEYSSKLGMGYFRVRNFCVLFKHRRAEPLFSEREGYRRHYRIPLTPWRVRVEFDKTRESKHA